MNVLPQLPSRLLRATAFAARWLFGLLLAAWLALVVSWGVLHGWIVPRIEEYRPALERQATRALGVPVRIGSIRAETLGLVPSFELRDVALYDPAGNVALLLPRVAAALSPRSVWNLGFEQLYIDRPVLDVRRAANGQIFVAGLDFGGGSASGGNGAERWFFSQTEFVIHDGQLRWTDEQRSVEPLALTHVNVLVRNSLRRHALHFDAALPPAWGSRFSMNARFRQPLLSRNTGNWRDWDGQIFTNFDQVDVSRLRQYADLGLDVDQGNGALRAWADLRRGQLAGATADLALSAVSARLGAQAEPLTLHSITGRLGGKRQAQGFEFSTQNLQFLMTDGRRWPGGNVAVTWKEGNAKQPPQGELHADNLDLAALGQMANLLPLGTTTHAALKAYAPQGLIEKLDGHWRKAGPLPAQGVQFDAKGRVSGLQIAAGPAPAVVPGLAYPQPARPGRPGIGGGSVDFDLTHAGGKAKLVIQSGSITLPGVLENPLVKLDALSADLSWQINGDKVMVQAPRVHFENPDTAGDAQFSWRSSDPAKSASRSRFPGLLDLQGSLSRGEGTQLHRYMPLILSAPLREYVQAAVQQGRLGIVKFKVKGDLYDLPFRDAKQGEFRIAAQVQNAQYAFVPSFPAEPGGEPSRRLEWPALTQLNGELVVDHNTLQWRGASARVVGAPGLQVTRLEAQIPDLSQAVVQVTGEARGPAAEVLSLVANAPVSEWTSRVLDKSTATGNADYKLKLNLPLQELIKSKVQGTVTLAGNDFQLNSSTPPASRMRGVVSFSETGFTLQGQAGFLGGDARIDGGTPRRGSAVAVAGTGNSAAREAEPSVLFRAQGTATAEGLQQAKSLGFVSRLAHSATGSTAYTATVAVRRGVAEIAVQSNLQGVALNLPPPFTKAAEAVLPLRFENTLLPAAATAGSGSSIPLLDQMVLDMGAVGSLVYVRDLSGPDTRVLRGGIGIGLNPGESVPLPAVGVAANINLGDVDVDAWEAVLSHAAGTSLTAINTVHDAAHAADNPGLGYLPNTIAVRAKDLHVGGYHAKNVVAGGSREGLTWRANVDANELSGYLEYRQSSGSAPGRVFARLARLLIAPSTATQVEAVLNEQPASIPALDIVVEDLDLRGKKLGRIEVEAVNRVGSSESAREWRLNKFNILLPEATFSATGNWAGTAPLPSASGARRTAMTFKLDVADAGQLLTRFGMKDVVKRGQGKLEGQVSWTGSPLAIDHPSLGGQFNIDVENGQFLKADPGLAKLLGVLSLQSLPRRLTLDFRDVFSEGFAFDFVRGDARIDQGIAFTNNLQMKGVNAAVLMEGRADIAKETQDLKVVVVPEINAGTASLVASVINPVIGLTTFLTQLVLRRPLIEAATQEFHIDGTWADPHIVKINRRAVGAKLPGTAPEAQPESRP